MMSTETVCTDSITPEQSNYAIDTLLARFHGDVTHISESPVARAEMLRHLHAYNPQFRPVSVETMFPKAEVLAQVVAGIYAPLIHGFCQTLLRNMTAGILPTTVIAPPRDTIPLVTSLSAQAALAGIDVTILTPHVNRNTAGISNNQHDRKPQRSDHLDAVFDHVMDRISGKTVVEIETGIYGTTSMVTAEGLKRRGLESYAPVKFYGLGPNLSYAHAVLSGGGQWVAEHAEYHNLVDAAMIGQIMVLLDTMEELGMEKFYRSVSQLTLNSTGEVVPVFEPVSKEELETARVTNEVIAATAEIYKDISASEVYRLLSNVPNLIDHSKRGLPFTLTEPIPAMDSKDEHFARIRETRLFDYPHLLL